MVRKKIDSNKIYLSPQTVLGSWKPPVLLEADNKAYFTQIEILLKAYSLQKVVQKGKKLADRNQGVGVGIYRSGIKQGLPVYYIGGYYDRAGVLESEEDNGVEIKEL